MNNISFQGRTHLFLDPQKYSQSIGQITSRSRCLGYKNNYTLHKAQMYASSPDAGNLAVLVRNENQGFLKFIPLQRDFSQIIDDIAAKTEILLSNTQKKLTAWVIGGEQINGKNGGNTIKALNEVAEVLCDRADIDTSLLVGAKNPQENILIHTPKDVLNITLEKPANSKLEDLFDIVELNNTEIM